MTPEPDFLKPPIYEVNANNFVSEAMALRERFPNLFIGVFNITTAADMLYESSRNYEGTLPDYAKELRESAQIADLDSASKNIAMVSIVGDLKK